MKQFVILFQPSPGLRLTGRQGPFNLTEIAKARRQAAFTSLR
jgi:hypothetical protein